MADAISFDGAGELDVVIDWKSNVAPSEATPAHYCGQASSYLRMTGAKRGLIVLATSGKTIWIHQDPSWQGRRVYSQLLGPISTNLIF